MGKIVLSFSILYPYLYTLLHIISFHEGKKIWKSILSFFIPYYISYFIQISRKTFIHFLCNICTDILSYILYIFVRKNYLKHILSFSIPYYILYLSYAYFLKISLLQMYMWISLLHIWCKSWRTSFTYLRIISFIYSKSFFCNFFLTIELHHIIAVHLPVLIYLFDDGVNICIHFGSYFSSF